jgi:predicted nucleotidyltransferase
MGITKAKAKSARNPTRAPSVSTRSLADALFTATQQRLLGLLFGQPERSFFVTELITLADVGRGAVQRELARLEQARLVLTERHGNQKHYRANPDSPVYAELCSIVGKTVGIEESLRAALEPLRARLSLALIYGSVARHADTASSDIDLLVVSDDLTLEDLYATLANVEQQLGRRINPTLYTNSEFRQRRSGNNAFLSRVLAGPTVMLEGQLDGA